MLGGEDRLGFRVSWLLVGLLGFGALGALRAWGSSGLGLNIMGLRVLRLRA